MTSVMSNLQDFWIKLFNMYTEEPPPSWEAFEQEYAHVMPVQEEWRLDDMKVEQWIHHIRLISSSAGRGTDSWRAAELKRLPSQFWGAINDIFRNI
eukprot:12787261-Heterocapsa_arctica.AAC.1